MIDTSKWFDFSGKVVLITGGRRGIGKAVAKAFAAHGATVVISGKSATAGDAVAELDGITEKWCYCPADLEQREERKKLIDFVIAQHGRIDILINNAGMQTPTPIFDYSCEQWDSEISLLLTASFELAAMAGKIMAAGGNGGKIINMASISSFQGARNIIGYSTAKHGIVGLTKCLANEFAPLGINVNAIAPGIVRTDMSAGVFADEERLKTLQSRVPDGRFAEPEDIVGSVFFLSSEMSSHVHGHVLLVDGGWMGR